MVHPDVSADLPRMRCNRLDNRRRSSRFATLISTCTGVSLVMAIEMSSVPFEVQVRADSDFSAPTAVGIVTALSSIGIGTSGIKCVARDVSGNLYIGGQAYLSGLPITDGAFDTTYNGDDGFVAKLTPDGATLIYSTYLGGSLPENVEDLAVAPDGSVIVVGSAYSTDFPVTPGVFQASHAPGNLDAFVTVLDPTGSSLVYSTYLGGSADDEAISVTVSPAGEVIVTGYTETAAVQPFPTTPGAFDVSPNGQLDCFVTRLNVTGTALVFSTLLGGSRSDAGYGVELDSNGNVILAGSSLDGTTDFPTTPGAFSTSHAGQNDVFVSRLSEDGSQLIYSTLFGGPGSDSIEGFAVDAAGRVYVTGFTSAGGIPTSPGAFDSTYNGGSYDVFAAGIDLSTSTLILSTYLGSSSTEGGRGVAVASDGTVVVCGSSVTPAAGFPITTGSYDTSHNGDVDGFISRIAADGTSLIYSTFVGTSARDEFFDVVLDGNGGAIVVGNTESIAYPTTPGAFDTTPNGTIEGVVTKLNPQGSDLTFSTRFGGTAAPPAGADSIGIYVAASGAWFLRNTIGPGPADIVYGYGPTGLGWVPLLGDWDANGSDTPGLYDPATGVFFLKNSHGPGPADIVFGFGPAGVGWIPLAGDWDGDAVDTVGLYDPVSGVFFLKNLNIAGPANLAYGFGPANVGWIPISGDWDGDSNRRDTVGLYDQSSGFFFLRNDHSPGGANFTIGFGPAGQNWRPLAGDWDGDGIDTIGLYAPATGAFFLRNANSPGPADVVFGYGPPTAAPLAGDWDGF